MTQELSKADKKAARSVIDIAVQRDLNRILSSYYELLHGWKKEKPDDNRQTYKTLYKSVRENDKYIAFRYDGLSGSDYFQAIVSLLLDEVLTEKDLSVFSVEARERLLPIVQRLKNS